MGKTADLTLAKKRKKDEFYTQLVDIENELKHCCEHFKGPHRDVLEKQGR